MDPSGKGIWRHLYLECSKHTDLGRRIIDLRPSPASKMSSGEQNRVLTHSIEKFTWLEELASESNTIQTQWIITAPGRLELQTRWNYMYVLVSIFKISQDQCIRLGSRCLWTLVWSISMVGNQCGAVSGLKNEFRGAKSRADALYWKIHMARRTCFREQCYTGTRNCYCARKIGGSNPVKLYVLFGQYFQDFSRSTWNPR